MQIQAIFSHPNVRYAVSVEITRRAHADSRGILRSKPEKRRRRLSVDNIGGLKVVRRGEVALGPSEDHEGRARSISASPSSVRPGLRVREGDGDVGGGRTPRLVCFG